LPVVEGLASGPRSRCRTVVPPHDTVSCMPPNQGTGGQFCFLIVKSHPDGTISLESVEHRTQHVGILPNGDAKGPHQTGTGDHGKFYVNFAVSWAVGGRKGGISE